MEQSQFIRTVQLIGSDNFAKLKKAKIALFGLGAVGSLTLENLVRSGVENFYLVDFDQIRLSNFNRQILALKSTLGRLKVDIAKERILDINPSCNVVTSCLFASYENFDFLLKEKPDILVDAIDSLNPKVQLICFALENKIPLISSMGAAGKTDPFSIRIGNFSEVKGCRLARMIRIKLKKKNIVGDFRTVYSTQPMIKNKIRIEEEEEFLIRGRKRNPIGSISYITGIFGCMMSFETIRMLTGFS